MAEQRSVTLAVDGTQFETLVPSGAEADALVTRVREAVLAGTSLEVPLVDRHGVRATLILRGDRVATVVIGVAPVDDGQGATMGISR